MKLLLIINPISGDLDKEQFLKDSKEMFDFYGIEYEIYRTTGENDEQKIDELAKQFSPEKVAVAGGDGTVLMAALALKEHPVPLGIIPLGSANGLAEDLQVNEDPLQALRDIIMSARIGRMDLLRLNQKHYCMHLGDVGLNASLIKHYEEDINRGMLTYAKAFIKEFGNSTRFKFNIKTESQEIDSEGVMLGFCNGRYFGTGIPLNSRSNPFDKKFEIVIIRDIDVSTIVKAGFTFFADAFPENLLADVITCQQATITLEEPRLLQLDGETISEVKKLDIELIPAAIPIIATAANPYI